MTYKRHLEGFLKKTSHQYPIVTIIGPRQSGKSTLARKLFSSYSYTNLENPEDRELALEDPKGFFRRFQGNLIIDEVQRVPDLLSYLQVMVDDPQSNRKFVLTGSHQLLLMENVTQSLAGRTVIAKLLPFSQRELEQRPISMDHSETKSEKKNSLEKTIFWGGYPRIYDKKLDPKIWHQQYYQTYIERDVRALSQIHNLELFNRFIRLCAGRVGQLLNLSSLANDCGITAPTASAWLSVLKLSFLCFTLEPHFKNFNKRIIKSPKLYFYDTGMLCYLLRIPHPEVLETHNQRGEIFENWVISEWMKSYYHQGLEPPIYFWRDLKGHEVDMILDHGSYLYPVEIKSSFTFHSQFTRNISYLNQLQDQETKKEYAGECIYAGEDSFEYKNIWIRSWREM